MYNHFLMSMDFERIKNKEDLEGKINLENLSIEFCDDDFIRSHYKEKKDEMPGKDEWLEENPDWKEKYKDVISKAVENGVIPDGEIDTIWRYQISKRNEGIEPAITIKKELKERIEDIKLDVAKRLSKYLPDWKLKSANVNFTVNENADYYVDDGEITVDLVRLATKEDYYDDVVGGMAHEIFHIWMKEGVSFEKEETLSSAKSKIILGTVDEGLATLVGNQSLYKHHEDRGRNYSEYKDQSFRLFKKTLESDSLNDVREYDETAFKDMGNAYVVGYEMANSVLQKVGIEKFRKLIVECKADPEVMLKEYEKHFKMFSKSY